MSLNLDVDPDGLFVRLGRIGHIAYLLDQYQDTLPEAFDSIVAAYQDTLQAVGGLVAQQQLGLVRSTAAVMGFARTAAQQTVIQMVEEDEPATARNLTSALREVIRQMGVQVKTVQDCNVAFIETALPGMVGNGVLVTSDKRGDGLVNENAFTEQTRLVVTSDSYSGSAAEGKEVFTLTGETASAGVWDWDYPQGSGASISVRAISADDNGSRGSNLTTNGDMEDWTADATPELEDWTLSTGTWGTDALQNATGNRGSFALEFNNGATLTTIYQEYTTLVPLTSYAFNFWLRRVSAAVTGILTVELTNTSNTVINDEQGVANSFTVDLSALTTSYVAYNHIFRLPAAPPATVRLRIRVSTAIGTDSILIDDVCLAALTAMYTGGPGFAIFSGSTPFVNGDGWEVDVDNDRPAYLASFQALFDRLFGMRQLGLLLPSSATPAIDDALITTP